jgi:glucan 1,3-beta-glucosidase
MAEDRPVSTVNSDYATPLHSPLSLEDATLAPPRASFFSPGPSPEQGTPRDSIAPSASGPEQDGLTPAQSTTFLPAGKESGTITPPPAIATKPLYRRPAIWAVALAALVAIILSIILPVYFLVIHKNNGSSNLTNSGNGNGNGKNPPTSTSNATSGGDGSQIVSGNTSFTYSNPFGGFCEFSLALQ